MLKGPLVFHRSRVMIFQAARVARLCLPGLLAMALLVPPLAPSAHAQSTASGESRPAPSLPVDPVLAQLIEESLAARPELKVSASLARAEEERIAQAGALPDPVLSLGIQNDGFRGIEIGRMETSYISIMGSQSLPWPGKRGLRAEVASLGTERAKADLARARLSAEADVRRAYLELLLARERLGLLDRLAALWEQSERIARVRYEAGEGAQSDLLRAQLERARLQQRRWLLEAEQRTRVQVLNRYRAHPLEEPIPTTASLRELPEPALLELAEEVADAEARSPELASAQLGVERAGRGVALARKERLPDFTVSAGIMPRGGEFPPMWQAGLSFNLPVFAGRKQERAISENEARAEAEQQGREALSQVLRQRVLERRTLLSALLDTLRLYRSGLLVQSQATADSTLAQYRVGRVTFVSVLEAIAGNIGDEESYLQAVADAQRIAIARAEVSLQPVSLFTAATMSGAAMPGAGALGGTGTRPASTTPSSSSAQPAASMPSM